VHQAKPSEGALSKTERCDVRDEDLPLISKQKHVDRPFSSNKKPNLAANLERQEGDETRNVKGDHLVALDLSASNLLQALDLKGLQALRISIDVCQTGPLF